MQHVCIYNVCVRHANREEVVINKAQATRCRLSNRAVVTHAEGPGVCRACTELFITVMKPGGGVYVLYLHAKYVLVCVYVNVKETECMCEVTVQASDQ